MYLTLLFFAHFISWRKQENVQSHDSSLPSLQWSILNAYRHHPIMHNYALEIDSWRERQEWSQSLIFYTSSGTLTITLFYWKLSKKKRILNWTIMIAAGCCLTLYYIVLSFFLLVGKVDAIITSLNIMWIEWYVAFMLQLITDFFNMYVSHCILILFFVYN